jgi:hypothetical protein
MFNNAFFIATIELNKLPVIAGKFSLFVNKQNSSELIPPTLKGHNILKIETRDVWQFP